MDVPNRALVLDLVEWLSVEPRAYADVMDAWRTSCPGLTIWEDAVDLGFVRLVRAGDALLVEQTDAGKAFLAAGRRAP